MPSGFEYYFRNRMLEYSTTALGVAGRAVSWLMVTVIWLTTQPDCMDLAPV